MAALKANARRAMASNFFMVVDLSGLEYGA